MVLGSSSFTYTSLGKKRQGREEGNTQEIGGRRTNIWLASEREKGIRAGRRACYANIRLIKGNSLRSGTGIANMEDPEDKDEDTYLR